MKRSVSITQANDYAARTMVYLGKLNEHDSIPTRELANELMVPYAFLVKLLQKLARAGITASQKGRQGGITLKKKPEEITLRDIFEAVDGMPILRNCLICETACFLQEHCSVSSLLNRIQTYLDNEFEKVTLAQLCADMP